MFAMSKQSRRRPACLRGYSGDFSKPLDSIVDLIVSSRIREGIIGREFGGQNRRTEEQNMERYQVAAHRSVLSGLVAVFAATAIQAAAAERVCELITPVEASAALGVTVPAGTASAGPSGGHLCRYIDPQLGILAISLAEEHGRQVFDQAKASLLQDPTKSPENISGLGDQAVFVSLPKNRAELLVLKGDKSVAIALAGPSAKASKQALTELGRKAVSRL
jgi:hypothetical protein